MRVGVGGSENLIEHVPCLALVALGVLHTDSSAWGQIALNPNRLFPTFFLFLSFLFRRKLFCSITNLFDPGVPPVTLTPP